jgi:DNA-binding NarL/FixJ family response regulator
MPGMNGLELREEICKDEFLRKKSIPFVFLTTTNGKHIIDQVYAMQVQGFFQKKDSYTQIKNQIKLIIDYWLECKHPNNY